MSEKKKKNIGRRHSYFVGHVKSEQSPGCWGAMTLVEPRFELRCPPGDHSVEVKLADFESQGGADQT
jgi:hypothetical protein